VREVGAAHIEILFITLNGSRSASKSESATLRWASFVRFEHRSVEALITRFIMHRTRIVYVTQ